MLRDRPEMCKDMLSAAALLRKALDNGWPVSGIDVEVQGNAFDLALGIAWLALIVVIGVWWWAAMGHDD